MKPRNVILILLGVLVIGSLIVTSRRESVQLAPVVSAPSQPGSPAATGTAPVPASTPDTGRIPHYYKTLAEAGELPRILPAEGFPIPIVAKAYRAAAKIREVLALQPCYCFCDKMGHGSLLDCFATDHGAGWAVCVKEVLLADQMTRKGKKSAEIREAIMRGEWERVSLED